MSLPPINPCRNGAGKAQSGTHGGAGNVEAVARTMGKLADSVCGWVYGLATLCEAHMSKEQFQIMVAGKSYTVTCEGGNMLIDDGGDVLLHFPVPTDNKVLATIMVMMRMGFLTNERGKTASVPVGAW